MGLNAESKVISMLTLIVNLHLILGILSAICSITSLVFTYCSTRHITYRQALDHKRAICEKVGGTYKQTPDPVECGNGELHDPVAMLLAQAMHLRYSIIFQALALLFSIFR